MKLLKYFAILIVFSLLICPVKALPAVSAKSAILVEAKTGYVLFEKNADEVLPMASTTKLFTALMVLECCELNEVVTVSKRADSTEGSSAYISEGERLTVEQLLYALLLSSGNDAAEALAEHAFDGDRDAFIEYMNQRASELGLTHTRFVNPSGLPEDEHLTTARELMEMARMAWRDDVISRIVSTKSISFTSLDSVRHTYTNHNSLLSMYPYATGMKTGFTKAAGRCLVSSASKDGVDLICVTLRDPDDWDDHMNLFDYGFSICKAECLALSGEITIHVNIAGGEKASIMAGNMLDIYVPSYNDTLRYDVNIQTEKFLSAPVSKGQTLGKIYVLYQNKIVDCYDCVALEDVPAVSVVQKNFFQEFKRIFNLILL